MTLLDDPFAFLRDADPRQVLSEIEAQDAREECQADLLAFVRRFWHVNDREEPFVTGWALEAICDHLMAVTDGEIRRLIVNVSPGSTKPVADDELVMTRRGRIALRDVAIGDEVLTHHGRFRRVIAVHDQGSIPVVRIVTMDGRIIRSAPDHPFLTADGWKKAGDLTPHDVVAAVVPTEWIGAPMPNEEARFLGYLVGDGSTKYHQITFTNADDEVLEDFERCAALLGFPTYRKRKARCAAFTVFVGGDRTGNIKRFLQHHDLWGKSSYTKRIPIAVMAATDEAAGNFLGAYWSCDGMTGVRHQHPRKESHIAKLSSVSEALIRDSQHLMLRLGMAMRVRRLEAKLVSKRQGSRYVSWDAIAQNEHMVSKIKTLPGLCSRKAKAIERSTPKLFETHLRADAVVSVENAGHARCRCLTVEEDASFTAQDIAVSNSLLTDVFWPAWEWGAMGRCHYRYVCAAYTSHLTQRDNRRFLRVIRDAEYRRLWGHLYLIDQQGQKLISNDAQGWKLATSVEGVGTGERGHRVIIDDPNNPKDVESDTVRENTEMWLTEVMPDRLNDLKRDAIVLIQQRTHARDATGVLDALGTAWTKLVIPAEYDPTRHCITVLKWDRTQEPPVPERVWEDPRGLDADGNQLPGRLDNGYVVPGSPISKRDGELFWPERIPREQLEEQKVTKGPVGFAQQYQQWPTPRGGNILRADWWRYWGKPDYPEFTFVLASLDTAFKEKETADFNAFTVWGMYIGENGHLQVMLRWAWRARCNLAELAARAGKDCQRLDVDVLLIEDKARGHDTDAEIKRQFGSRQWSTQLEPVDGDKVSRAQAVVPILAGDPIEDMVFRGGDPTCDHQLGPTRAVAEHCVKCGAILARIATTWKGGLVWAPDKEWAQEVIDECAAFPYGEHDDYVDSTTQALNYLRKNHLAIRYEEFQEHQAASRRYRKPQKPPYDV